MINRSMVLISLLIGSTSMGFSENNNTTDQEGNTTSPIKTEKTIEKQQSSLSSMEEQIQKALLGVSAMKVLKTGESKVIFESEAMVLERDTPKKIKKTHKKRKVHKRVIRKKEPSVDMDNLPMAKTYPMDYDLSKITE